MGFVIFAVIVALICSLGNNGTWSLNFWTLSAIIIAIICIATIIWAVCSKDD